MVSFIFSVRPILNKIEAAFRADRVGKLLLVLVLPFSITSTKSYTQRAWLQLKVHFLGVPDNTSTYINMYHNNMVVELLFLQLFRTKEGLVERPIRWGDEYSTLIKFIYLLIYYTSG